MTPRGLILDTDVCRTRGRFLCPNPYNISQLPSTREGKVVDKKIIHELRTRGRFLCPDSHIIPQLPSTREGKVVDSKSFMNEKREAVTSTKETLV